MELSRQITEIVETTGLPGVLVLMFLEVFIPLIQSEFVMTFAGFAASRGVLDPYAVALAGIAGSQLGSLTLFALFRPLSEAKANDLLERYGGWLGFDLAGLERAQDWFRRNDRWAVIGARIVPGLRAFVAIPAGIQRMPFWRFFLANLFGAAVVIAALTWLGVVLGENYQVVERYSSWISWGILSAVGAYVLYRVVVIVRR